MREILFRGKRPNGRWVQGDLTQFCIDGVMTSKLSNHDLRPTLNGVRVSTYTNEVVPETVGQYTGLTDKNGTKIFEGDIVKHHRTLWGADNSDVGIIQWHQKTCKFYRTSKFDTVHMVEIWEDTSEEYEVIGNIHDNPELLKEREGK